MLKNYTHSKMIRITEYYRVFDDGCGNGAWFPCYEDGSLKPMSKEAYANYKRCLKNGSKQYVRFNKIVSEERWIREEATGVCSCGTKITLTNQYHGACSCPECGQWYNLFGEELDPPEEWSENKWSSDII